MYISMHNHFNINNIKTYSYIM